MYKSYYNTCDVFLLITAPGALGIDFFCELYYDRAVAHISEDGY